MRWLLAALALAFIVGNSALAEAAQYEESRDGLTTTWPVTAIGDIRSQTEDFAFRFDPTDAHQAFHLEADKILIEMEWEQGFALGDDQIASVTSDQGTRKVVLRDAALTIAPFQGEPIVFAMADQAEGTLTFQTTIATSWNGAQDVIVVHEGMSPYTQTAGDEKDLGFWYIAEGPIIEAKAKGTISLTGSFSLFLHNVEVHAQWEDNKKWSQWTGYREEETTLAAKQYELRITTVQVTNGTLVAIPEKPVALYTSNLDVQVDGQVEAQSVTGKIVRASKVFQFDQEPLRLKGTGDLKIKADLDDGQPRLLLQPSEDLRVEDKDPLQIQQPVVNRPYPEALLLTPLAILLVTATTAGLSRSNQGRALRHRAWTRQAEAAAYGGHWDRSSRYYQKALRARPDQVTTWHDLIQTRLQAQQGLEAERLARQAATIPGMDPWDLLTQRTAAAWLRGDQQALQVHLKTLEEGAPEMATQLKKCLHIEPHPASEGHIDGYA